MPRTHGYSTKGTRGRINVIGALFGKALFKCNINSIVFGRWVEDYLLQI